MSEKLTNSTGARDGRTLSHDTLEQIRLRAFERVEAGESITNVARTLGFDRAVVGRWIGKARKHGVKALHAKPIPGRPPILDDRQVEIVRTLILAFEPDVWGFTSVPWTRAMVAEVIEKLFGVRVSDKAVGHMMRHRMGLTPQRPVRRAFGNRSPDTSFNRSVLARTVVLTLQRGRLRCTTEPHDSLPPNDTPWCFNSISPA